MGLAQADERSSEDLAFKAGEAAGTEAAEIRAAILALQITSSELVDHSKIVNGSIKDGVEGLAKVEGCMGEILEKMNERELLEKERERVRKKTEDDREKARVVEAEAAEKAREEAVTNRSFKLGVTAVSASVVVGLGVPLALHFLGGVGG